MRYLRGLTPGAIAGAVAGLLLAPQSGRETRRQVRSWLEALGDLVGSTQGDRWTGSSMEKTAPVGRKAEDYRGMP